MNKAIVLLSGGLDSATVLYYARSRGYQCSCLIFDYGQRHRREIRSAQALARRARCEQRVVKISFPWKGSSLLNTRAKIPENCGTAAWRRRAAIPSTYVPARNIIFLSFALSYAETAGAGSVFIGANAVDYSGYPDCRPEFFRAFERVIRTGTKAGITRGYRNKIKIETPLIDKSKKEIVALAMKLKVPLEMTWSCYQGGSKACGVCDSCVLRAKGFCEAGYPDPAVKNGQRKDH